MTLTLTPIGTIHSPYTTLAGMPIQPAGAKGVAGTVELLPELTPGLGRPRRLLPPHPHLLVPPEQRLRALGHALPGQGAARAVRHPRAQAAERRRALGGAP